MIDQSAPASGRVEVRVWCGGILVEHSVADNLIVSASRFMHARLLGGGDPGSVISQIGFGSSSARVADGNTALSTDAYIKPIDAVAYPAANKVSFGLSLGLQEANDMVLAEYGLISVSGRLYARLVRTAPLVKDPSISLSATWTITF